MKKIILSLIVASFLISCSDSEAPAPKKTSAPQKTEQTKEVKKTDKVEKKKTVAPQAKFTEPKTATIDPNKKYSALIETSKGTISVELYAKDTPVSVTNFTQLAQGGFYDGLTFHRVEPGFVIQGGDPQGNGRGGPGYTIVPEIKHKHIKGALAWARTGDQVNPERRSSGSQFYITLAATPFLDGAYTVFGKTISGFDVVGKIARGDKIISIKVKAE